MTIYDKYAKLRAQELVIKSELKEIEEKILEEIAELSEPLKTEVGKFSKVKLIKWEYSDTVKEEESSIKVKVSELLSVVKTKKEEEETNGIAKATESIILRFTPNK